MTPESNAGPTVVAGNLPASLRGIYTALGWAFFVACVLCYSYFNSAAVQHDRANTHASQPAWLPISLVSFLLLPMVVCCFLLSTRRSNLVAAGAGVACGYFGALVIGSPFALLMMLLLLGLSASDRGFDHGLVVAGLALIGLFAISPRIVRAAWRIRQVDWNRFLVGVAATAVYVLVGFKLMIIAATIR